MGAKIGISLKGWWDMERKCLIARRAVGTVRVQGKSQDWARIWESDMHESDQ